MYYLLTAGLESVDPRWHDSDGARVSSSLAQGSNFVYVFPLAPQALDKNHLESAESLHKSRQNRGK